MKPGLYMYMLETAPHVLTTVVVKTQPAFCLHGHDTQHKFCTCRPQPGRVCGRWHNATAMLLAPHTGRIIGPAPLCGPLLVGATR